MLARVSQNSVKTLHSYNGKTIHTDTGKQKASIFSKKQLAETVENSLPPFKGDAKPSDCPFIREEVVLATSKLKKIQLLVLTTSTCRMNR